MIPYEFFLDQLFPLPLRQKKMFGVTAFYLEEKLLFALNTHPKYPEDIGIWVAAQEQSQELLKEQLSNFRYLKGIPTKKYLLLAEDSDTFEADAAIVAHLIKKGSSWIGKIPKKKKN